MPPLKTVRVVFSPVGVNFASPKTGRMTLVMLNVTDASRTSKAAVELLEQSSEAFFTAGCPRLSKSSTAMHRTETLPVASVIGSSQTAGVPASGVLGQPTCSKLSLDDVQRTVMTAAGPSSPSTVVESTTVEAFPSST
jgi:hypothetical protein